jgi:putative PIN family toxin of toxin-antitoxin system
MRVVLDTNVLISGTVFGGRPEMVLQMASTRVFSLIVSAEILAELEGVLIEKFGWSHARVAVLVRGIRQTAELVVPKIKVADCEDPDDNRILEAAVEGLADVIVSGDKHLLRMKMYRGIKILAISEFLTLAGK